MQIFPQAGLGPRGGLLTLSIGVSGVGGETPKGWWYFIYVFVVVVCFCSPLLLWFVQKKLGYCTITVTTLYLRRSGIPTYKQPSPSITFHYETVRLAFPQKKTKHYLEGWVVKEQILWWLAFRHTAKLGKIPSRELTYPLPRQLWWWFSFSKCGIC